MGDAVRAVGRVDMLPARAAGPVDVDLQVIVVDRDVDLLGLGQHRDGRCAGVDTPAAFGNGDALDAVDAALEFELGEDALPRNAGDHLLVTADLGLIRRDDFDLPALRIGIAAVHAEQVAREPGVAGAHPFDWAKPGRDLFDIDAWG